MTHVYSACLIPFSHCLALFSIQFSFSFSHSLPLFSSLSPLILSLSSPWRTIGLIQYEELEANQTLLYKWVRWRGEGEGGRGGGGEMQWELKSTGTQCQNANRDQCHTVLEMKAALIRTQLYSTIYMNWLTFAHAEMQPCKNKTVTWVQKKMHTRTNIQIYTLLHTLHQIKNQRLQKRGL